MAGVGRSVLTLRFSGEDLDPVTVTRLLGAEPSRSCLKGDVRPSGFVEKAGSWRLSSDDAQPGDLQKQILEMFERLTQDLAAWSTATSAFKADLFCGLFMKSENEGLDLEASTLEIIAERGLRLSLDIYSATPEE